MTTIRPPFVRHPLRAALALALTGTAALAQAQGAPTDSNVQVFGALAVSAVNTSHQAVGSGTRVISGPWSPSLLGVRGTESLGNGLSASFRFEGSVDPANGVGGRTVLNAAKLWDRAAWVGIGSDVWTLTAGRQLHAGIDRIASQLDLFQANGDGKLLLSTLALNATNSFGGFDTRVDDALKLRAQGAGWSGGISRAQASAGRVGTSHSADVGYQGANFGVGGYLLRYHSDGNALAQKTWGLGGNVAAGPARIYAHYMKAQHDKKVGGRLAQQDDQVIGLGVAMPLSGNFTVKAAYYRDSGSDVGGAAGRDGKRSTVAVQGDYALSKRTSLLFGAFHNKLSGAFAADPTSLSVLGLIDPATRSISGHASTGIAVGVQHRF